MLVWAVLFGILVLGILHHHHPADNKENKCAPTISQEPPCRQPVSAFCKLSVAMEERVPPHQNAILISVPEEKL